MPGQESMTEKAQQSINEAVAATRDAMDAVFVRDQQLNSMQEKTEDLVNTSAVFGAQAARLKSTYDWQRYRLYMIVGMFALWVICAVFFQKYLIVCVISSTLFVVSVFLLRAFIVTRDNRRYSGME
mmetsp:Transcript_48634/g.135906  ORF Transcript_48634/g.135906 Transcript_48634/m.135906 type:complete len:126 (-) Transcript_48634:209-586(-)